MQGLQAARPHTTYTLDMATDNNKPWRATDTRFWVGVAIFAIILPVHVLVKELPVWFLALPAFLMGADIVELARSIWKK